MREPSHELTPDRLFARQWALGLLARVLDRLEAESRLAGKAVMFERIRPASQGDGLAPEYRAIAAELGMTQTAVRVAARRLRLRYRQLLREEVGRTTCDPAEIDEEIDELLIALTGN